MAAPKKRRSLEKVKRRQNIIFFDSLCGNWSRRREWFYRHLANLPVDSNKTWTPMRFPGFWPGNFFNTIKKLK